MVRHVLTTRTARSAVSARPCQTFAQRDDGAGRERFGLGRARDRPISEPLGQGGEDALGRPVQVLLRHAERGARRTVVSCVSFASTPISISRSQTARAGAASGVSSMPTHRPLPRTSETARPAPRPAAAR